LRKEVACVYEVDVAGCSIGGAGGGGVVGAGDSEGACGTDCSGDGS